MIAIVRYNAGNTQSVLNALARIGAEGIVTDDPETIRRADRIIFPGVGQAAAALDYLRERRLDSLIRELRQPFLGICLGLQLLCDRLDEGNVRGLGIFNADVRRFPVGGPVPHMGWNDFTRAEGELFCGIAPESDMYFVHSYCADVVPQTVAVTDYLVPFSAALQKDNFYGVQFHPEKSGPAGLRLLQNFLTVGRQEKTS